MAAFSGRTIIKDLQTLKPTTPVVETALTRVKLSFAHQNAERFGDVDETQRVSIRDIERDALHVVSLFVGEWSGLVPSESLYQLLTNGTTCSVDCDSRQTIKTAEHD